MADRELVRSFVSTYHLINGYNMLWYRKNFCGMDPQQGQGRILSALQRTNNITQKELGTLLDMRPQSLGELLQKLEAHGYIKRHRSTADKRALVVELTSKGEMFQASQPDYDDLFDELTMNERSALKSSLVKISNRLRELIERETAEEFY